MLQYKLIFFLGNCKCGKQMKLRNGKFGEFWGCSGYPECNYTMNI